MKSNKSVKQKKLIGITMGDPCGIGPEVVAKALAKSAIRRLARFVIIGDQSVFRNFCPHVYPDCVFKDLGVFPFKKWKLGQMTKEGGAAAAAYLEESVRLIKEWTISGLVTAPLSKEAVAMALPGFRGHTEFLAEAFGVKRYGMFFVGGNKRVIVATRHIPIKEVSSALSTGKVLESIELTHECLVRDFRILRPRIAVCGLNPHAGEGGKIGNEEQRVIIPALKKAQKNRILAEGPFPSDTLFVPFIWKKFDAVVAMYHDQGLIPVKAFHFNELVNMTVGLPFVRTSPAHGTGFNIAADRVADPSSMIEAIKLAAQLTR